MKKSGVVDKYKILTDSKIYGIFVSVFTIAFVAYLLTIVFPQYLFAYEITHKNLKVYARVPFDENINQILDAAETKLEKSPVYDASQTDKIFLTGSYKLYTLLSNRAYASFGNSVPLIDNILINKTDGNQDLVFAPRDEPNSRSLSGVIAHEVTHLMIRNKFGAINSLVSIPTWKNEGYFEYVAGATTLSFDKGVRLWKENSNDVRLAYFKYHQMVKYLLDDEKINVEDLFNRDFDQKDLEQRVYRKICQN